MHHERTMDAARGKWRGILLALGLPAKALTGKHCPCPMCGGKDRFRWTNYEGHGGYICNQCGSGDGIALAMAFLNQEFLPVAKRIDVLLGNEKFEPDKIRPALNDDDRRKLLRAAYVDSEPMRKGDLADKYLASRGLDQAVYPPALRFSPRMSDGEGGVRPCMIAQIGVYGAAVYATMHRTFLRPDGNGKAEMAAPRKLMPGPLPDGACVALSEYTGGVLGVAEGVETALAATAIFEIPVWSTINSANLQKWQPPQGCEEVAIFGDHDAKYGGQAAAYALAHKLAVKGIVTSVHIPSTPGEDWADEWARWRRTRTLAA